MFTEHKKSALASEQRSKLEDIIARVKRSEDEGTYATVDGVDTVDDIWYLLDMIRHLDDTVIHARGLLADVGRAYGQALSTAPKQERPDFFVSPWVWDQQQKEKEEVDGQDEDE